MIKSIGGLVARKMRESTAYALRTCRDVRAYRDFRRDFRTFERLDGRPRFRLDWEDRNVWLGDKTRTLGFDRHYVYHLGWAARVLSETRPGRHVDIGAKLEFPAILSAFLPLEYGEYRPPDLQLSDLSVQPTDVTDLPYPTGSIESLSCMHVVEHIGLGRYGDPLDPGGDLKAIGELKRVTAPGGQLLFVVPLGHPRIAFNAHRIYGYEQVIGLFPEFELIEFALIPERGHLLRSAEPSLVDGERYACGCFHLHKPAIGLDMQ